MLFLGSIICSIFCTESGGYQVISPAKKWVRFWTKNDTVLKRFNHVFELQVASVQSYTKNMVVRLRVINKIKYIFIKTFFDQF